VRVLATALAVSVGLGCGWGHPRARPDAPPPPLVESDCVVVDVPATRALPERSEGLGRVAMSAEGSSEEAVLALHDRVCALGGNRLTGLTWYDAPGGLRVEADAWRVAEAPRTGPLRFAR
jgi:hypothetical protein